MRHDGKHATVAIIVVLIAACSAPATTESGFISLGRHDGDSGIGGSVTGGLPATGGVPTGGAEASGGSVVGGDGGTGGSMISVGGTSTDENGGTANFGGDVNGGTSTSGQGGTTGANGGTGGKANGGTGGTSGGGGTLDLEPACRVFCDTWLGRCATDYDTSADCAADCVVSYEGVREECRRLAAPYLECAGATETCQFRTVPQSCSAQVNALRDCVFGNPPACEIGIVPTVEGCDVMALCDGTSVLLGCDGENDGTGTSLCDCQAGGEIRLGIPVDGIGLVACSNALLECAR